MCALIHRNDFLDIYLYYIWSSGFPQKLQFLLMTGVNTHKENIVSFAVNIKEFIRTLGNHLGNWKEQSQ